MGVDCRKNNCQKTISSTTGTLKNMARVGCVIYDVGVLDFTKISFLFQRCLKTLIKEPSNSELDIILLNDFHSYIYLDEVLGKLYSICRDVLLEQSLHMLPINIYFGSFFKEAMKWDLLYVSDQSQTGTFQANKYELFKQPCIINKSEGTADEVKGDDPNRYDVSALGGTFDHIHDGHKILLSIASFLTKHRLIVGITVEELLVNKSFKEYLESFEDRCNNVTQFLKNLKPTLNVEISPLKDVCGPTGKVPEIQSLIVSRETVSGGKQVNETRNSLGMNLLEICVVNVLGGRENDGWSEKLSSTEIRKIAKESHN